MLYERGRKFLLLFLLLTAAFTMTFRVSAAGEVRYVKLYGRNYVYLRDVARYYGMTCSAGSEKTVLYSKYSRLEFTVDKKHCYINKTKVALLFPCVKYKYYRCISAKDFLQNIDPIIRHWALKKKGIKRIMLDPGHGGKDKGGIGRYLYEKKITLPIARKVASTLKKKGYEVYLTRNNDRFIELEDRPALARKVKADIFVSIHANKTSKSSVDGIETFCMTPQGAASSHSSKISWKKYKGNANTANNTALAYWVQHSLINKTKADDRGLKFARYMVLKEATCPAILIEVGFLSNPREEKRIATEWYQWQLAKAIADGIARYDYQLRRRK